VIAVHSTFVAEILVTGDIKVALDLEVMFLIAEDSEDCARYSFRED
jgi:hypothetical protein